MQLSLPFVFLFGERRERMQFDTGILVSMNADSWAHKLGF